MIWVGLCWRLRRRMNSARGRPAGASSESTFGAFTEPHQPLAETLSYQQRIPIKKRAGKFVHPARFLSYRFFSTCVNAK